MGDAMDDIMDDGDEEAEENEIIEKVRFSFLYTAKCVFHYLVIAQHNCLRL